MIDETISKINATLLGKLPWLNRAFGRAFNLQKGDGTNYPAVHKYGLEYQSVLPNDEIGNFSFITIADPSYIDVRNSTADFDCNLIFWLNMVDAKGKIEDTLHVDAIRHEIIEALSLKYHPYCTIKINGIYENANSVYEGYSLKQVDTQYLMLPFYGFRISLYVIEKPKIC